MAEVMALSNFTDSFSITQIFGEQISRNIEILLKVGIGIGIAIIVYIIFLIIRAIIRVNIARNIKKILENVEQINHKLDWLNKPRTGQRLKEKSKK